MSRDAVIERERKKFSALLARRSNGFCRLLSLPDDSSETDDSGFPQTTRSARITGFIPCLWIERPLKEIEIALQTRGMSIFVLHLPILFEAAEVIARASDQIELQAKFTSDTVATKTLEAVSVINLTGIALEITAMNLETGAQ